MALPDNETDPGLNYLEYPVRNNATPNFLKLYFVELPIMDNWKQDSFTWKDDFLLWFTGWSKGDPP